MPPPPPPPHPHPHTTPIHRRDTPVPLCGPPDAGLAPSGSRAGSWYTTNLLESFNMEYGAGQPCNYIQPNRTCTLSCGRGTYQRGDIGIRCQANGRWARIDPAATCATCECTWYRWGRRWLCSQRVGWQALPARDRPRCLAFVTLAATATAHTHPFIGLQQARQTSALPLSLPFYTQRPSRSSRSRAPTPRP